MRFPWTVDHSDVTAPRVRSAARSHLKSRNMSGERGSCGVTSRKMVLGKTERTHRWRGMVAACTKRAELVAHVLSLSVRASVGASVELARKT